MKIVEKVNPIAVKRSIGINIRDYFGMYLLYENKTLLYYYIILLKKYMYQNMIMYEFFSLGFTLDFNTFSTCILI